MRLPVKYYKHASTIEDADSKIIVDCSELTDDESLRIEKAINNYVALVGLLEEAYRLIREAENAPLIMADRYLQVITAIEEMRNEVRQ